MKRAKLRIGWHPEGRCGGCCCLLTSFNWRSPPVLACKLFPVRLQDAFRVAMCLSAGHGRGSGLTRSLQSLLVRHSLWDPQLPPGPLWLHPLWASADTPGGYPPPLPTDNPSGRRDINPSTCAHHGDRLRTSDNDSVPSCLPPF